MIDLLKESIKMLIDNQVPNAQPKEVEAFNATVTMFKLRLTDIASDSGVLKRDLENFKKGTGKVTSRTLSKIILALSPVQRSFYSGMIALQSSTEDAGVKMPVLSLNQVNDGTDIYRDALDITLSVFGIKESEIAKATNIAQSNISTWRNKRRDVQLITIDKIKAGLKIEQRNFFNAMTEVLFILSV